MTVTAFFCLMFSWIEFLLANGLATISIKPIAGILSRVGGVMVLMRNLLAQGFSMGRLR